MEELLSLKWNNHKSSFLHLLTLLRKQGRYTDVTLACEGLLYKVHKIVLAGCSDYFSHIFESISSDAVIVLKDITASNLESLLDYMYLGEVNVRQSELSSLIQAAECLRLKGLAVPDADTPNNSQRQKRSADVSPKPKKKIKRPIPTDIPESHDHQQIKDDYNDVPLAEPPTTDELSPALKSEEVVTIKEETTNESYVDTWNYDPAPLDFASNQEEDEDSNTYREDQSYSIPGSYENLYTSNENMDNESSNFANQSVVASGSQSNVNTTVFRAGRSAHPRKKPHFCPYNKCRSTFGSPAELKRHIRTHTGEKPFPCPYCPYRASLKSSVTSHMLTHLPKGDLSV